MVDVLGCRANLHDARDRKASGRLWAKLRAEGGAVPYNRLPEDKLLHDVGAQRARLSMCSKGLD
jgi:hypothetical protein